MSEILAELSRDRPTKDDRRILNYQHKGYAIVLGKNSFSNERIVLEHPHRECIWMHAMAARGSSVILCIHDRPEPDEEVMNHAGSLALKHSHSETRTVLVSILKDVFKPEGSGVGIWKANPSASMEVTK